jgi:cytochrome P450
MPFSAGERRCLGDRFSLMEQKVLLMNLLSRYQVKSPNGQIEEGGEEGIVERASDNLELIFNLPKSVEVKFENL